MPVVRMRARTMSSSVGMYSKAEICTEKKTRRQGETERDRERDIVTEKQKQGDRDAHKHNARVRDKKRMQL